MQEVEQPVVAENAATERPPSASFGNAPVAPAALQQQQQQQQEEQEPALTVEEAEMGNSLAPRRQAWLNSLPFEAQKRWLAMGVQKRLLAEAAASWKQQHQQWVAACPRQPYAQQQQQQGSSVTAQQDQVVQQQPPSQPPHSEQQEQLAPILPPPSPPPPPPPPAPENGDLDFELELTEEALRGTHALEMPFSGDDEFNVL